MRLLVVGALERARVLKGHFDLTQATSVEQAIETLQAFGADTVLVVADDYPTAQQMLKQFRKRDADTPLMMWCDGAGVSDRVEFFRSGANDCLGPPYNSEELMVRLRALAMRSSGNYAGTITVGQIVIDPELRRVTVGGAEVSVRGTQYKILLFLALRKGRPISRQQLLNHVYGDKEDVEDRMIDVHVMRLRIALGETRRRSHIHTLWGVGYVLKPLED